MFFVTRPFSGYRCSNVVMLKVQPTYDNDLNALSFSTHQTVKGLGSGFFTTKVGFSYGYFISAPS